uniref:uncharacterized protein LOC120344986 n=1 Tax=Styela clava TaxID=7725 RepID=UPI001939459A|nr:uncharacterized protein LOC120344986 [Styela clava]
MEIPLRVFLIRLLLIIEAFSLIKGEKCWAPMLCNNIPVWEVFRECEMTEEFRNRKKALEEKIIQLASMITLMNGKLKTPTATTTKNNAIHTLATDVKETTKPQEIDSVKTSSVIALVTPAKSLWTTGEAFFSTLNSVNTSTVPASTSASRLSLTSPENTVNPQTTSEPFVQTIPSGFTDQGLCDGLLYLGKCYRASLHTAQDVNYNEAVVMCTNMSAKPADIIDSQHYDMVVKYIQTIMSSSYEDVWLAMTFDHWLNIVLRSDGTAAQYVIYTPGAPYSHPTYTQLAITVRNLLGSSHGMFNAPRSSFKYGVLCQKE